MIERRFGQRFAEQLRTLAVESEWTGTTGELHAALIDSGLSEDLPTPPHLGRWLRRSEPTLWWDYGIRVKFSRTGVKRQVHLSRREVNLIDRIRRW